jgi:glycosyltransferase involved in cell wall biosynthesis
MTKILYLSYTGLMEPLGYSQIYSYLKDFDQCEIHLITVEKSKFVNDKKILSFHYELCRKSNINWSFLVYSNKWRILASFYSICQMLRLAIAAGPIDIVHARAYVAGLTAYIYKFFSGSKFVFDMRALWVDELISINSIKKGSLLSFSLYKLEGILIKNADSVVSLTKSAVDYLVKKYKINDESKFSVIPTCVDLNRFDAENALIKPKNNQRIIFGSIGGILSGWYNLNYLLIVARIISNNPNYVLKIITQDDHSRIIKLFDFLSPNQLILIRSDPLDMPKAMCDIDIGVLFFQSNLGKLGSAPTRLAEYLAMGIPVITNSGVGDMSLLVSENKLGCVFDDDIDLIDNFQSSVKSIIGNYQMIERCKSVCASVFSLDVGVKKYIKIYSDLLNN